MISLAKKLVQSTLKKDALENSLRFFLNKLFPLWGPHKFIFRPNKASYHLDPIYKRITSPSNPARPNM